MYFVEWTVFVDLRYFLTLMLFTSLTGSIPKIMSVSYAILLFFTSGSYVSRALTYVKQIASACKNCPLIGVGCLTPVSESWSFSEGNPKWCQQDWNGILPVIVYFSRKAFLPASVQMRQLRLQLGVVSVSFTEFWLSGIILNLQTAERSQFACPRLRSKTRCSLSESVKDQEIFSA